MPEQTPTIVLVHGAFAESASWSEVIEELQSRGLEVVAVANPLRSVAGDAAYVRDVISGIGKPVVLVAHSYGGVVITEAAARNSAVVRLVYVAGFAPDHGESAFQLSTKFPGSTLADTLTAYPVSSGGNELAIRQDVFRRQFAADVPPAQAAVMGATQRPVTEAALSDGPAHRRPGLAAHPLVVRLRRPGRDHPGRAAPVHGRAGRRRGQPGAGRCVTRAERLGAQGRHRDDPRGHRRSVTHDALDSRDHDSRDHERR